MRQGNPGCNRDCASCDLFMQTETVLSAYDEAISCLFNSNKKELGWFANPLTKEELMGMKGNQVYIINCNGKSDWEFISYGNLYGLETCKIPHTEKREFYRWTTYGDSWIAYEEHPERRIAKK